VEVLETSVIALNLIGESEDRQGNEKQIHERLDQQ